VGGRNIDAINQESAIIFKNMSGHEAGRYKAFGFLSESQYRDVLNAADFVISRAGSAIFEIAAFGKPSALIPLPESANDHQHMNALEYFQAGACIYFEEQNLLPNLFLNRIDEIFKDDKKRAELSAACAVFAKPNAADIVADEILRIATVDTDFYERAA